MTAFDKPNVYVTISGARGPRGERGLTGSGLAAFDSTAEMRAALKSSLTDGQYVTVGGYTNDGDGGGGVFRWDAGSSATADSGLVFSSNEGGTGRWIRIYDGMPSLAYFGILTSGSDQSTTINSRLAGTAYQGGITIPPGIVYTRRLLVIPSGITLADEQLSGSGGAVVPYGGPKGGATSSRLARIETFLTMFGGRGSVDGETPNVVSEQNITVAAVAGATAITVATPANFTEGGQVMIEYPGGTYLPHFVSDITGSVLTIIPPLKFAVANGTRIERMWFNKAHPGKFGIRYLAQRITRGTELELAVTDSSQVAWTGFESGDANGTLVGIGTVTISYQNAAPLGVSGDLTSVVRYPYTRTAYIELNADGEGFDTPLYDVVKPGQIVMKLAMRQANITPQYVASIISETGQLLARKFISVGENFGPTTVHDITAHTRNAVQVKGRVQAVSDPGGATSITVASLSIFDAPECVGSILPALDGTMVLLGDSWIAGDIGSTVEREPLDYQLRKELPYMKIINAGIGGNTAAQMLTRFDTDVTPYAPDYVVISETINNVYNPSSVTFDPNALDDFFDTMLQIVNRCLEIGARPILLGMPAAAQSDADAPSLAEWQLLDRARSYNQDAAAKFGRMG